MSEKFGVPVESRALGQEETICHARSIRSSTEERDYAVSMVIIDEAGRSGAGSEGTGYSDFVEYWGNDPPLHVPEYAERYEQDIRNYIYELQRHVPGQADAIVFQPQSIEQHDPEFPWYPHGWMADALVPDPARWPSDYPSAIGRLFRHTFVSYEDANPESFPSVGYMQSVWRGTARRDPKHVGLFLDRSGSIRPWPEIWDKIAEFSAWLEGLYPDATFATWEFIDERWIRPATTWLRTVVH